MAAPVRHAPTVSTVSITALQHFRTLMDARAAAAERNYQVYPELSGTAAALLRMERLMHKDGWEMAPHLFFLRRHMRSGRVDGRVSTRLTSVLHHHCALGAPPAQALTAVAEICQYGRDYVDHHVGGMDNTDLPPLSPSSATLLDNLLRALPSDGDMLDCGTGHRFDGVGFATIAYATAANPDAMNAARVGLLHAHPDRVEVRQICYMARDGWSFEVVRARSDGEVRMPRYCIPANPDDTDVVGTVPQAVSRLCNALVGNPVPIRPSS